MKLKYYLRGLGIGIAVTSVVLSISSCTKRKISDEEIIKRAEALGMVTTEHTKETLFEDKTTEATTEAPTTESTTEDVTVDDATTEGATTEAPTTEAPTTEAPTTEAPTTEAPTTEAPTTEAPTTEAPTTEAVTEPAIEPATTAPVDTVKTCTVVITGGMYSEQVSRYLQQQGIIRSAAEFDEYLYAHHYDTKLQKGSFTVSSDMTFEQIAMRLMKRG